jgi:hypothetical protein
MTSCAERISRAKALEGNCSRSPANCTLSKAGRCFSPFDRKRPTTRATVLFRSVRAGINDVWPGRSVVVIVVVTKGLPDLRKRPKGGI